MTGILIDSNVILDLFEEDSGWVEWSEATLHQYSHTHTIYINPIIYSEVSMGFKRIEELENALSGCGFELLQIPKEALFLVGKAYYKYRKRKGTKLSPLPDFFIGAHAAIDKLELMTRDALRYKSSTYNLKL